MSVEPLQSGRPQDERQPGGIVMSESLPTSREVRTQRAGWVLGLVAASLGLAIIAGGAKLYLIDRAGSRSAAPPLAASNSAPQIIMVPPSASVRPPEGTSPDSVVATNLAPSPEAPTAQQRVELPVPGTRAEVPTPKESSGSEPPAGTKAPSQQSPRPSLDTSAQAALPPSLPKAPPLKRSVEPENTIPAAAPPQIAIPNNSTTANVGTSTALRPAEAGRSEANAAPTASSEIALLLQRGDELLSTGDIASARHFFERAADHGDGAAATRLGKTYDPLFLQQSGVRGVSGDSAKAVAWYRKGISSGDIEAEMRLQQLLAKYPQ
jgi:hypothetical protein